MRYGLIFVILAILIASNAATYGSAAWLLLYPAASFAGVGMAYLSGRHDFFGKRPDGTLSPIAVAVLMPYLVYVGSLWHLVRLLWAEPPLNRIDDELLIGRRLLNKELPPEVKAVIDLTSEFTEPARVRSVAQYICFPMLDASTRSTTEIAALASSITARDAPVYIHCAQGHGRTGLIAASLLLASGKASTVDQAIKQLEQVRPKLRMNAGQRAKLAGVHHKLANR